MTDPIPFPAHRVRTDDDLVVIWRRPAELAEPEPAPLASIATPPPFPAPVCPDPFGDDTEPADAWGLLLGVVIVGVSAVFALAALAGAVWLIVRAAESLR